MKGILIVDDDDSVRATIALHLAHIEAEIVDVSSGKAAIDLLLMRKFDLIISDLFMPEVDGIKFISETRRIHPTTPIILVTGGGVIFPLGSINLGTLEKTARIMGASQILEKPFKGQQLREMVKSLLVQVSPGQPKLSVP